MGNFQDNLITGCQKIPGFCCAAEDDGGGSGDNCNSHMCKDPPPPYQHSGFYKPEGLPVTQPTASDHWRHRKTSLNVTIILFTRRWCRSSGIRRRSSISDGIASTGRRHRRRRERRWHISTTRCDSWIRLRHTSWVRSAGVITTWTSSPCNNCCVVRSSWVSSYDMAL